MGCGRSGAISEIRLILLTHDKAGLPRAWQAVG